jgi:hypothetical protein
MRRKSNTNYFDLILLTESKTIISFFFSSIKCQHVRKECISGIVFLSLSLFDTEEEEECRHISIYYDGMRNSKINSMNGNSLIQIM